MTPTTRRKGPRSTTVVACATVAVLLQGGAMPCARQAPSDRFDGSRAYEHLRQVVAFGPRPAGSPALETTRAYIRKQLAAIGLRVVDQAFEADTPLGRIPMVNLIARIPGTSPDRLIIGGHYDTKLFREFRFVGANDAGSSTAFLIELARVLQNRRSALSMELVFFDGEEAMRPVWGDNDHTYGSRHYVAAAKRDGSWPTLRALILVDMIGDRDLAIRRELTSTPWLTDIIWATARQLGHGRVFVDAATSIEDDHIPFLEAGLPAVDIIDGPEDYPYWHTAADTLDKVSAGSLQTVGDVLLASLPAIERRLGTSRGLDSRRQPPGSRSGARSQAGRGRIPSPGDID